MELKEREGKVNLNPVSQNLSSSVVSSYLATYLLTNSTQMTVDSKMYCITKMCDLPPPKPFIRQH